MSSVRTHTTIAPGLPGDSADAVRMSQIESDLTDLTATVATKLDDVPELLVDVTADGATDNLTVIQNALDEAGTLVGSRYGRTVVLNAIGNIGISASLVIPDGVVLAGRGPLATQLRPLAGFSGDWLVRLGAGASQYEHGMGLVDLQIYLDDVSGLDAVYTSTANEPAFLERVRIASYRGYAVHAERLTSPSTQQPSHLRISDCELFASDSAPSAGVDESIYLDTVGNTTLIERTTIRSNTNTGTKRQTAIRAIDSAVRVDACHVEYHTRGTHVTLGATFANGMLTVTGLTGHPTVDDVVYISDRAPHALVGVSPHGATNSVNNTSTGETITGRIPVYTNLLQRGAGVRVNARTVTGYTYLSVTDDWIDASTTGAFTIELPSYGYTTGKRYVIRSVNSGQVTVTPEPNTRLIDGVTSKRLDASGSWVEVVYDGTTWRAIQSGTVTDIP